MIAEHVPSVLDYGLYGLLAVVMIRELFSLIRFAFTSRKNGNPGNPHMTASELRGYLQGINNTLQDISNAQVAIQTKLDQVVSGVSTLLTRRGNG